MPGYHEISAKLGIFTPTRVINAQPGEQLYFALDWKHSKFPTSAADTSVTMTRVHSVLDLATKE